jgi:hypothetical protein
MNADFQDLKNYLILPFSLYYILAKLLNFIKKKNDSHRVRRARRERNELI